MENTPIHDIMVRHGDGGLTQMGSERDRVDVSSSVMGLGSLVFRWTGGHR